MTKFDLIEILLEIPDNPEMTCLGVGDGGDIEYAPIEAVSVCADGRYFIHGVEEEDE